MDCQQIGLKEAIITSNDHTHEPVILDSETASHLYSIRWDEGIEAVVFRWRDFASGERFRTGANALLDGLQDTEASKLLVDARNMTAHDKTDQRWLVDEWVPEVIDAGIEYLVTVHENNPLAEAEMRGLVPEPDAYDISSTTTDDITAARTWIADK